MTKRIKHAGGRPNFRPTETHRKAVQVMAGFGIRQDEIRMAITAPGGNPITEKTLRRHFREELDSGRAAVKLKVCTSALRRMHSDNSGAMNIFLLKTIVGLKETTAIELTGKDGGPVETKDVRQRNIGLVEAIASRAAGEASGSAEE